jgi:hypothetical protein
VKFSSGGAGSSLGGKCFAGLGEDGLLRVFRGHPDSPGYLPIWSSSLSGKDSSLYGNFFRRVYLEVSDSGELAVFSLAAGSPISECLWSSESCSPSPWIKAVNTWQRQSAAFANAALVDGCRFIRESKSKLASFLVDLVESFGNQKGISDLFAQLVGSLTVRARALLDKLNRLMDTNILKEFSNAVELVADSVDKMWRMLRNSGDIGYQSKSSTEKGYNYYDDFRASKENRKKKKKRNRSSVRS